MKIAITSDHGGFELKGELINYLKSLNHEIVDLGTDSNTSVDYPDYGHLIGREIASGDYAFGIALCGTGIGISIACNKVKGIRAALIYSKKVAVLAREHNNANIICLGARTTTKAQAIARISAFMNASFLGGRHEIRINKIEGEC
jgi:ribose 5-phosphate isomerase B